MHKVVGRFVRDIFNARVFGRMPLLATCVWGSIALLAILLTLAALFLPAYTGTVAPQKDAWKRIELSAEKPIRAWLVVDPEHIHLGDVFSLTVHVVWLTDEVEFSSGRLVNSILLPSFVERGSKDLREEWEGRSYYRRTYTLQALFASASGSSIAHQVAFTDFAYKKQGSQGYTSKNLSLFIHVVSRFGQGAQPTLASLKGPVYPFSYYARVGTALLAIFALVCALFATIGALWPKPLRKIAVSLEEEYAGLGYRLSDARNALFALEYIAGSILLKHGESPASVWAQKPPVWHTDLWARLWGIIPKAYREQNPTEQDAQEAYRIVGTLIKYQGRKNK